MFTGGMTIEARRVPVVSTYHGVEVSEDYRWLEDASSPETIAWTEEQAELTRAYFASLPWRGDLRGRVEGLLRADRSTYSSLAAAGDTYFVLKEQTPRQRPFLVTLTDLDDTSTERVLVDPEAIDPTGETAIDWFVPGPGGQQVAVSMSEHGTEDGTLFVYDVATGEVVGEPIPHVHLMGGSMAWRPDGTGFWFTRCADPAGFGQQVWYRDLEGGGEDRLDFPAGVADESIAENVLSASADGHWLMDRVQKGDGGEWQIFLRPQEGGEWWLLAEIPDNCPYAVLGADAVYLLSRKDAPHGRILRLPLSHGATVTDAVVLVPTSDLVIEDVAVTDATIWVADMDGGPQQLRAFALDGRPLPAPEVPPVSTVSAYWARLVRLGRDRVAWQGESFTEPSTWWVAADGEPARRTALTSDTPVDLSGYVVTREFATSWDGTRVPLNVIAAPGTPRDGTAPALLTAYGGYNISLVPHFSTERVLWLERGGVYVVANIRGGGEYGQEWHQAGRLGTKQNCFDDFIACADHLVDSGVTSRDRLAIMGGSNGGLLMGAVITQRPDLARACIAAVPVMDSLRSEITMNGRYNTTEFGSVEDPEHFKALLDYSPYHNVRDGVPYPAVLLTAGENDIRVDAWHAKKMTARLQAATSSGLPILLRMETGGHLSGSLDQTIDETTDLYAFLFDQVGVEDRADEFHAEPRS
jgi:prolyl oligopeptidase